MLTLASHFRKTTIVVISLAVSFPVLFISLQLLFLFLHITEQITYSETLDPLMLALGFALSPLLMLLCGFVFSFDVERFSRTVGRLLIGLATAWVLFIAYCFMDCSDCF